MNLCAPCVAALVNNPYSAEMEGLEGKCVRQDQWAALIEEYAEERPGRATITATDGGNPRVLTLRAVTVAHGVPLCTWCTASRAWQGYSPRYGG